MASTQETSMPKTSTQKTTVIRGGRVIDPANGIFDQKRTVYLRRGTIVSGLDADDAGFVFGQSEDDAGFVSGLGANDAGLVSGLGANDAGFVAESGAGNEVVEVFDADGAFVSPGFVDAHAHVLKHATQLGLDADQHCLANGKWWRGCWHWCEWW